FEGPAAAWIEANRNAFLDSYLAAAGERGQALGGDHELLLRAFELDKAVYEVMYEARHRPPWLQIPLGGIRGLLGGTPWRGTRSSGWSAESITSPTACWVPTPRMAGWSSAPSAPTPPRWWRSSRRGPGTPRGVPRSVGSSGSSWSRSTRPACSRAHWAGRDR